MFAAVACTTQTHGVLAPRKELLALSSPSLWTAGTYGEISGTRSAQHLSFVLCIQDGTLRWQQRAREKQTQDSAASQACGKTHAVWRTGEHPGQMTQRSDMPG